MSDVDPVRRAGPVVLAVIGLALVGGCSTAAETAIHYGIPESELTQQEVLFTPGYGGVFTACHGSTRLYIVEIAGGYSGPPVTAVPADPTCGAAA